MLLTDQRRQEAYLFFSKMTKLLHKWWRIASHRADLSSIVAHESCKHELPAHINFLKTQGHEEAQFVTGQLGPLRKSSQYPPLRID